MAVQQKAESLLDQKKFFKAFENPKSRYKQIKQMFIRQDKVHVFDKFFKISEYESDDEMSGQRVTQDIDNFAQLLKRPEFDENIQVIDMNEKSLIILQDLGKELVSKVVER